MRDLIDAEDRVLADLAAAWNEICRLPDLNPAELHELSHAIGAAENVILARPALEARGGRRPSIAT